MNRIGTWICRRPIVSFFVITFVISWGLGFSAMAVLKNEQFLLMPLAVVTACAPALAGIIVSAVGGGQSRRRAFAYRHARHYGARRGATQDRRCAGTDTFHSGSILYRYCRRDRRSPRVERRPESVGAGVLHVTDSNKTEASQPREPALYNRTHGGTCGAVEYSRVSEAFRSTQ